MIKSLTSVPCSDDAILQRPVAEVMPVRWDPHLYVYLLSLFDRFVTVASQLAFFKSTECLRIISHVLAFVFIRCVRSHFPKHKNVDEHRHKCPILCGPSVTLRRGVTPTRLRILIR